MNERGSNFRRQATFVSLALAIQLLFVSTSARAASDIKVENAGIKLRIPSGIAIRTVPGGEGYQIYVADAGAGRILRIQSDKLDDGEEAIAGFVSSSDVEDLVHLPGPHGLLFIDANRLVVTGSEGGKRPFVRLYEITDQKKPLPAEQHEQQAAPATGEEHLDDEIDSFHLLARTRANDHVPDFLILTAIGKEAGVSVWRLPIRGGTMGDLKLLGKDQPEASPLAVAVEPRGHIVLVRPAEENGAKSIRIAFVNPIDGRTVLETPVKLPGIVGAAYSPRSGNLYAISSSTRGSTRSGVYRIDADEASASNNPSANATKVAEVDQPTAFAFGPDGTLYVTSLGVTGDVDSDGGKLLKITGEL